MLSAQIIRPDALTPGDLDAWAEMRGAHPAFANPLFGPRWAQAVAQVRPDAQVAVLRRGGRTVGFLPHHRRRDGYARPIGAPFCDLHALIAEPDSTLTFEEVVRAAGLRAFAFTGLVDPENRASDVQERFSAYVVEHRPGDDVLELVRSRNPKRFKNWRRLGHKLEREQGAVALDAPDRDPDALASLLGWKSAQLRQNGMHDVFRPAWVQALMRNLFATKEPEWGGLQVTLRTDGRAVAGEFGVREGGAYHPWIAGFDPRYAPYSPGIILQLRLIERMEPLGLTRYDLGRMSDYKAPLTTGELEIKSGVVRARGDGSPLRAALDRSSTGSRIVRRWDQIGAVETTGLGRAHALLDALRDVPGRLGRTTPKNELGDA